jgi:hypothetical protein
MCCQRSSKEHQQLERLREHCHKSRPYQIESDLTARSGSRLRERKFPTPISSSKGSPPRSRLPLAGSSWQTKNSRRSTAPVLTPQVLTPQVLTPQLGTMTTRRVPTRSAAFRRNAKRAFSLRWSRDIPSASYLAIKAFWRSQNVFGKKDNRCRAVKRLRIVRSKGAKLLVTASRDIRMPASKGVSLTETTIPAESVYGNPFRKTRSLWTDS